MLTGYHRGSLAEGICPSQERGLWGTSAQRVLTLRGREGDSWGEFLWGKEAPWGGGDPSGKRSLQGGRFFWGKEAPLGGDPFWGKEVSLSACVRSLFILILLSHVETMWEPCGRAPLPFLRFLASFLGRGHSHNLLSLSSHAPLSFPTISSACS